MTMLNPIENILQHHGVMVLDGALATELEQRGADLNDPLWSATLLLDAPDLIKAVHADYFAAGADCAITASYQATFEGFMQRGLSRTEAERLLRRAVDLAVAARDQFWAKPDQRRGRPKPIVAASVGSYGAFLADGSEYRGDYGLSKQALIDFHRPRLAVLANTPADIIACETIPCLLEAEALADLLADEFPNHFAWLSFSARNKTEISHGESFAACVQTLEAYPQIAAIGINCTPPEYLPGLIAAAKPHTQKPIIVYPNSGEGYDPQAKLWTGSGSHTTFGTDAAAWQQLGASIIGGCCRTTPADIAQIAARFRG